MSIFTQNKIINTVQRRLKAIDKLISESNADWQIKASVYTAIAEHCNERYNILSDEKESVDKK